MAVTVRRLKAQCQSLAEDLLLHGQASAEALRALAPGGAENPKRDAWAWVWYLGQLQLLRGRAQGPQGPAREGHEPASRDDAVILAALAARPEMVRGVDGTRYTVYPKSLGALLECHAREAVLAKLATLLARLKDLDTHDEHASLVAEACAELGYHTRLLVWIATTEGPGLPFPAGERRPALSDAHAGIDPVTVLEIHRAFARVNWANLRGLESLLAPDPEAGGERRRPSWSVFMGALAIELHEDPVTLIEHRALVSVMASMQLAASSQREAMAEAKRTAEERRGAVA